MKRDDLLILYHHHLVSNEKVLETVSGLSHERFVRRIHPFNQCVRDVLRHILGGDVFFLAVCQGDEVPAMPEFEELEAFGMIQARFGQVHAETLTFFGGLTDDDMDRPVTILLSDQVYTLPLWQTMVQQTNHAHQHRGMIEVMLNSMGYTLPNIDMFVHFVRTSGQEWPFED